MSPEQEQQVAAALTQGLSERETARQVGVSPTAVHRVRERLAQRPEASPEPEETTVTDHDDDQAAAAGPLEMTAAQPEQLADGDLLGQLRAGRQEVADAVAVHEERAAVSRSAVAQLEAERIEALAAGRDAQALRTRRRDAEDDARDSADAAGLARGRLAEFDRQIAVVVARQELAVMRVQLAEAVTERDALCAGVGERQRRAVVAVHEAAVDFVATFAEPQAAAQRVDELAAAVAGHAQQLGEPGPVVTLAPSTAISAPADSYGAGLALNRARSEAAIGRTEQVAIRLAETFGWLPPAPPTPEEIAAWQARMAQMTASAPVAQGSVPHPEHWPAAVSLDAAGTPLAPPDPQRKRPQQVVRPGSLGFQSFPQR